MVVNMLLGGRGWCAAASGGGVCGTPAAIGVYSTCATVAGPFAIGCWLIGTRRDVAGSRGTVVIGRAASVDAEVATIGFSPAWGLGADSPTASEARPTRAGESAFRATGKITEKTKAWRIAAEQTPLRRVGRRSGGRGNQECELRRTVAAGARRSEPVRQRIDDDDGRRRGRATRAVGSVNLWNGNFFLCQAVVSLPGDGFPLQFNLYFIGESTADGPFGVKWSNTYQITLNGNLMDNVG